MGRESAIMLLTLFTFICALGFGFYQVFSVEKSKQKGSTTALAHPPGQPDKTTQS